MRFETDENKFAFEGVLDETSDLAPIQDIVKTLDQAQEVIFDFSRVTRGNSCGILNWLRLVRQIENPITYRLVPAWLVSQFNMISEFFEGKVTVESVEAPFYCQTTDRNVMKTIVIGKDIPVKESYNDFEFDTSSFSSDEGHELEPDFDTHEYFAFIALNFDLIAKAAS